LDLAAAFKQGTYLSLDAGETLSMFMVDGLPEPERFAEVVRSLIERAVKGRRRVRIFGEMVAQLWNELHRTAHPFSLFCAPHSAVSGSTFPNSEKLRAKLRNMGSSPHSAVSVNAFIYVLATPLSYGLADLLGSYEPLCWR
jgi:hypothetical protein